jgi:hypothetical protein
MKVNTAIGFILLGISLILNQNNKYTRLYSRAFILLSFALILFQSRLVHRTAQVVTVCAVAFGFISLIGYASGIYFTGCRLEVLQKQKNYYC